MFSRTVAKNWRVIVPAAVGVKCAQCDESAEADNAKDALFHRQLRRPKVPYPLWDYDWDGLMTPDTTLEAQSNGVKVRGTTRHILLIRHGQYDMSQKEDEKRILTDLGRAQADLTGRRLAIMAKGFEDNNKFRPCDIRVIRTSDMERAKETARIIAKHLPDVEVAPADPMLNEALPAPIIPVRPEIDATEEIDQHAERIEAAFHKYIHRAPDTMDEDEKHEFEVIVGHGNVIRYFFCRALQLPPEAWLRMSIFNCSLTYIMVKPNGHCVCRTLGDIGHLGYEHSTFSNGHGFAWS